MRLKPLLERHRGYRLKVPLGRWRESAVQEDERRWFVCLSTIASLVLMRYTSVLFG